MDEPERIEPEEHAHELDSLLDDLVHDSPLESERPPSSSEPPPKPQRVLSIDALRGFVMFWIIGGHGVVLAITALFVVPIPEEMHYQMSHPDWIGFSAWDMIMPLFLFIVGVAMPFSLGRRIEETQSLGRIYAKIITRTVVLFVFGMIAQGNLLAFDTTVLHVYCNTLQAIAVGYLVSSILLLHANLLWQVGITAALLLGYWGLLVLVPVPGHEAGILEPRLNIALHIDQTILGSYEDGTTYTWILSGLGFAGTVMLGVFGGKVLRSAQHPLGKVALLLILGGACLGGGWLWSHQLQLPIIKHIWTSSMVLWAGGWSFLLLAIFFLVIDLMRLRWLGLPLAVIGRNAIFVYMAVHLVDFGSISGALVGGLANNVAEWYGEPYQVALLAVARLALIWLILLYMYRKRTFLKI